MNKSNSPSCINIIAVVIQEEQQNLTMCIFTDYHGGGILQWTKKKKINEWSFIQKRNIYSSSIYHK